MADSYWRYGDNRQLAAAAAASASASAALPVAVAKRSRTDLDVPSGHDLSNYHHLEDGRVAHRVIRDNDPIGASYDNYLRSQMSVYGRSESARPSDGGMTGHHVDDPRAAIQQQMSVYTRSESARPSNGRMTGHPVDDPRVMGITGHPVDDPRIMGIGGPDPALLKAQGMGVAGGRSELRLPPDASSTLFVEGLPANCTRREVAHIFRPFVGYKEVRLVNKESRHPGGDPLVLCFVDFISPAHAATAMDALEGYKFDEDERDSLRLRLQFARHPGARSGGGHRGKR